MKTSIYAYRADQLFPYAECVCDHDDFLDALSNLDLDGCSHVKVTLETDDKMFVGKKDVGDDDPAETVVYALSEAEALYRTA